MIIVWGGYQSGSPYAEPIVVRASGSGGGSNGAKLLSAGRFPRLDKKYGKHVMKRAEWSQWGNISKEAYYKRAVNLADSPVGGHIKGFTSKQGWNFRYNVRTGEFLTTHPTGYIETFFRPAKGMNYYLTQLSKYGN